MTLPQPLHRYELLGPLPGQGAEADVYRVRDSAGRERVVKLYRWGFGAQREVWRKLHLLNHSALMPILDKGTTPEGRDYEVMPYLSGGTVAGLLRGGPLRSTDVIGLVNQLAGGINGLHAAGIVHRDLKPENLLLEADRRHVVIADFGISRDHSRVNGTASMTPGYAPPEGYRGVVTPAWDWWSLGMIVRQLVTGAPPFAGMTFEEVQRSLLERDIDLGQMPEGPLRALCRGLLTRDPAKRWGARQVLTWLDGQGRGWGAAPGAHPGAAATRVDAKQPAAPADVRKPTAGKESTAKAAPAKESSAKAAPAKESSAKAAPAKESTAKAAPAKESTAKAGSGGAAKAPANESAAKAGPGGAAKAPANKAFAFAGKVHRTGGELAQTLRECGTDPLRKLFGAAEPAETQRRRLRELRAWMEQLPPAPGRLDIVTLFARLVGNGPPDLKALYLLRWLDPSGGAVHRGRDMSLPVLVQACAATVKGGDPEAEALVADLVDQKVLAVLAGFTALRRLNGVQEAHAELVREWRASMDRRPTVPAELRDPKAPAVRAGLLLAVLPGPEAAKRCEELAAAHTLPAGADVEWFNGLIKDLGGKGSPGERVVRAVCTRSAVREVRQREARKRAKEQTALKQKPAQPPGKTGTTVRMPSVGKPSAMPSVGKRPVPKSSPQRREALGRAAEWTLLWGVLWSALAWLGWGWLDMHISALLTLQILGLMIVPLCLRLRTAARLETAYRPPLSRPLRWLHEPRKTPWRPWKRLRFAVAFVALSGALIRGAAFYGAAKGTQDPFVLADAVLWTAALVRLFGRDRKHLRPWDFRQSTWRPQPRPRRRAGGRA
ncbi:protein kinase [Streptomyces sp. TP-A0356]|uniref:protein kinase domain-containing protein n=1 Tax=Streptomyces sp. TP-A0356 TaxID=1359208 RepID=UPI0006E3D5BC|nr:protein kinase [Streptomyces sp. TP-A0356]